MPVHKACRGGKYLYVDGSDGSGGQFLTPEWLYGRSGCRGGSGSRKTAAWLISASKKTLTALCLSFVEGPSNNEKDKKKSFGLMCQTPRKVFFHDFMQSTSGLLRSSDYARDYPYIYGFNRDPVKELLFYLATTLVKGNDVGG